MKRLKSAIALLTLGLFVVGCGPVKLPEQKEYKLTQTAKVVTHSRYKGVILVSKTTASSLIDNEDMHYSFKPYEMRSYVNHQWAARPADMLEGLIIKSLQNSHVFKAVVPESFSGDVNYRLKTRLISLNQSFAHKPSQVKMVLLAYLIDDKRDRIIRSARLKEVVTAPFDTPYGGVLAANQATSKLLSKLVQFAVK